METTLTIRLRWQCGLCREHTSTVKLAGGFTHVFLKDTNRRQLARLCRGMYGTRDAASIWGDTWSEVLKEVGVACPAFFCSHDGELKGLCHSDEFCVVRRRKQSRTFGRILEKRFEVKQTGHIGFGASDKKELKILNRTMKIDVLNDEMTLEADNGTMFSCSHVLMFSCFHVFMFSCFHVFMFFYVFMCICMCMCMFMFMFLFLFLCMFLFMFMFSVCLCLYYLFVFL